jgi:hypothetical protein
MKDVCAKPLGLTDELLNTSTHVREASREA